MTESPPPTPQHAAPAGAPTAAEEAAREAADALAAEEAAAEVEDFDAWRQQQHAKRTGGRRVRIFGKVVTLPSSLPLGLTLSMDTLGDSTDLAEVQQVVGALYGRDALDHWVTQGATLEDFQILLAWGAASAGGQNITFDRARELVAEAETKATRGKAAKGRKKPKRKR